MADDDDDFDFLRDEQPDTKIEDRSKPERVPEPDRELDSPFEGLPGRQSEEFNRLERLRTQYRKEMSALGAVWIVFGILTTVGVCILFGMRPIRVQTQYAPVAALVGGVTEPTFVLPDALLYAVGAVAVLWMFAGIGALAHSQAAVGVGLLLTYLNLIGNAISLNLIVALLLIFVIVQAHRVLKTAAELKAAGIST